MSWFRRNQKILMAVLVGVLMVAWGALPALNYLARRAMPKRGYIKGKPVTDQDIALAMRQIEAAGPLLGLLPGPLRGFLFTGRGRRAVTPLAAWRYLVLTREVEQAGVQLTADRLERFIALVGLPSNDRLVRHAVSSLLRIVQLYAYRQECVHVSDAELWMEYNRLDRKAKLRLVEIRPEIFFPGLAVTEEELRAFYEEHKDHQPDRATGTPGYRAPQRVRLEYAVARLDELRQGVKVSDEEVLAYYAQHKEEFQPAEETNSQQGQGAGSPDEAEAGSGPAEPPTPAPDGGGVSAPPAEGAPAGDEAARASTGGNGQPGTAAGPQAGEATSGPPPGGRKEQAPPPEVLKRVREQLVEEKVRQEAQRRVEKALDDLERVSARYVNQPCPLEQMARRYGLRYALARTATGEELLSRQQVLSRVPGGAAVARRVFDDGLEVNFPSFVDSPAGPMVVQVLERREPEPDERPSEGRGAGEADTRTGAGRIAGAGSGGVQRAAERFVRRRASSRACLRGRGRGRLARRAAAGRQPRAAGGEGDRFRFAAQRLHEAFRLGDGEFGLVTERGFGAACYVVEKLAEQAPDAQGFLKRRAALRDSVLRRKRQRAVESWLEHLLKESPPPRSMKA